MAKGKSVTVETSRRIASDRVKKMIYQEGFIMNATANKKKILCAVCGAEMDLTAARHYVVRDGTTAGLASALSSAEPVLYDAFDCPQCGCQNVMGERKRELPKPKEEKPAALCMEQEGVLSEAEKLDVANTRKSNWFAKIFAAAKQYGRRPSEQYVRGLVDAAYAYCVSERGMRFETFVRRWIDFLGDKALGVDEAYAMARLRTRCAKHTDGAAKGAAEK